MHRAGHASNKCGVYLAVVYRRGDGRGHANKTAARAAGAVTKARAAIP